MSGLVRLIELGRIDEADPLHEHRDEIAKIIARTYSRDVESTIKLRYELYRRLFGNSSKAFFHLLESLGMAELYAFLINKNVEDIILIPGKYVYINTKNGKVITRMLVPPRLVERFLQLAKAKGHRLLTSNPSFRYGLRLGPLRIRVSVDLPPIVSAPHIYVRVHRSVISLDELIAEGFIDADKATTLRREVIEGGKDLVVAGPPGSGKTTLLQAVDLEIPPQFLRVYIDEADEFLDIPSFNQIKINNTNKLREIFSSMNRNIDIFIIGELQYPEHFQAYAAAKGIGLQSLATVHASSIDRALERLRQFGIALENIVVIQIEKIYKDKIIRKVKDIYVR